MYVSLFYCVRNVQRMADIKTHVGYARAWVRLALEKKLLSTHMKELLADNELLRYVMLSQCRIGKTCQ